MISRFFIKLLIIVFIIPIVGFSQAKDTSNEQTDSLIIFVKKALKEGSLMQVKSLLNDIEKLQVSNPELIRLKINYYRTSILIANEEALQLLLKESTDLEKIKSSTYHAKYSEAIGRIFGRAKKYDSEISYFKQSLSHAFKRKDSLTISSANLNIGSFFQIRGQIDSARYYYEKVMIFHPKNSYESETLGTAYSNLIGVAVSDGNFNLAEHYGKKSLDFHRQRKDTLKMGRILSNLGSIKMYTRDLEESNIYYFEAHKLLSNKKDIKSREITALILFNISQVYYLQGNYKVGYDYLFDRTELHQKIVDEKAQNKIANIAVEYQLSKNEIQTKIEKIKRQKAEFWNYCFGISTFVLLILIWIFFRNSRLKTQKKELGFKQEKSEQAKEIEKMQIKIQIKILNATLDAKEIERKHISEILHGNVSTLLSSANMRLYALKIELKESASTEIQKIEAIVSEASEKVRDLSHKLISSVLLKFGLKVSIEDLCEKYSNSRLKFKFKSKNISRYDENFEIKIHNIVEELASNIMKHSNAYNATIKIEEIQNNLNIRVNDDGDGFNIKDAIKKDGLGLNQISARIKVMKGVFDIKSYENTGTQVIINIPIPE